jgi:hypothetical protein
MRSQAWWSSEGFKVIPPASAAHPSDGKRPAKAAAAPAMV